MNIKKIRNYLTFKKGCNITIIYYGLRNKKEIYKGLLYKTYLNVFTIILPTGEIKSFSYIDILTKTIKIYV